MKTTSGIRWLVIATAALVLLEMPVAADAGVKVLVYGGTPAGIAAAVAAAREGAEVDLIEPCGFVGGMMTNGLSHPDFRTFEGLSGLYLEFTRRVEAHYAAKFGADSAQVGDSWHGTHGEPKVNRAVLEAMLEEAGVKVMTKARLIGVKLERGRIIGMQAVSDTGESTHRADVFVDGSYEGDLMAAAGVGFRVGREARQTFGESLAPAVADEAVQAYNFRLTMTRDPLLRVPVPEPPGYRSEDFLELLPILKEGRVKSVFGGEKGGIYKEQTPPLPNGKRDINDVSKGVVRLSLPGLNHGWPDGTANERDEIFNRHLLHNIGMLHFLQTDARVPEKFQAEAREWGLCRDEFAENGHLPEQLYVREARRMIGKHIFTEGDTKRPEGEARAVFQPDSITVADYGINSHGATHSGPLIGGEHGGEFYHRIPPCQVPYGVMLPAKGPENLLVPCAVSASHVGFCALRFEPVWMGLGQAAGVAAALAAENSQPVAEVGTGEIRDRLHRAGAATIYVSDVPPGHPDFAAVQRWGSLGGLHGLHPSPGENPRGEHLRGQYFKAYPGHHAGLAEDLDDATRARWTALTKAAAGPIGKLRPKTRGEWIRILHRSAAAGS